jgi:hypothetical protein
MQSFIVNLDTIPLRQSRSNVNMKKTFDFLHETKNQKVWVLLICLSVYLFVSLFIAAWAFFSYLAAITVTGDGVANLDPSLALIAFCNEGSFLLRNRTSVYNVSFVGPAPSSHSGVQIGNVGITRSLRLRSNHCTTWVEC